MPCLTPEENSLPNRDKILRAAIRLFSQKGFDGVTQREIASEVGIRAASLYNHFAGKEAILDAITEIFRAELRKQIHPVFTAADASDLRAFLKTVERSSELFFQDPLHALTGVIVLREQLSHPGVRRMLLTELIENPRELLSANFERLMRAGKMRTGDPIVAAKEYHAFFIYTFYENTLGQRFGASTERERFEQAEHIRLFLNAWETGTQR